MIQKKRKIVDNVFFHDYTIIIGEIENLELKKNHPMNIKDLVWNVEAKEDSTSTGDYDKETINDCLFQVI